MSSNRALVPQSSTWADPYLIADASLRERSIAPMASLYQGKLSSSELALRSPLRRRYLGSSSSAGRDLYALTISWNTPCDYPQEYVLAVGIHATAARPIFHFPLRHFPLQRESSSSPDLIYTIIDSELGRLEAVPEPV